MTIQGVIFDLDGTLADTLGDITDAINVGLRSLGRPQRPQEDVRSWIGEGLPVLCRRALGLPDLRTPERGMPAAGTLEEEHLLERMVRIAGDHYRANSLNRTRPFPGMPELLDALTARGLPLAVLTNKPHAATGPMVEALFGGTRFVAVEGYREESRRKPDPRTALEIAGRMNVEPAAVALVGDSGTDMITATNAGLVPIAVTWGYRDREELAAAGARHFIDRPEQLLELVGW